MARTTSKAVRSILDPDVPEDTDFSPFIQSANVIVDRLRVAAINKGIALTTKELTLIEMWLAAYYTCAREPQYRSKSTIGASGSWEVKDYLEMAKSLDPSGTLAALMEHRKATITWLGKARSKQTPYDQRN